YDVQGRRTAVISSAQEGAIEAFEKAADADVAGGMRRTETRYDRLGRAVEQVLADRSTSGLGGGAEVTGDTVLEYRQLSSATWTVYPEQFSGTEYQSGYTPPPEWVGTNSVSVTWPDQDNLGNGDIKVELTYRTAGSAGVVRTRNYVLAGTGGGATLSWTDVPSTQEAGGISEVLSVRVSKQDVRMTSDGREIWKEIGYGTQPITQGTRLVVPRATDAVDVNDDSFGDLV
ncbi:hypothetical protein, partial [Methylibium rhizosphaerae]|uniref:hypothetical protein n=1 Tax=Methylibium rhizosphaerae TaxID=2570323 RepID=UPI0015E27ECA